MKTKCYPHVTGVYGDEGENPGALAIHAVLDPSPNYPENGRIIVGSPAATPTIDGYLPDLGGFNGGPAAIERLASTLLEAARDARAAIGATGAPRGEVPRLDLDDIERKAREAHRAHENWHDMDTLIDEHTIERYDAEYIAAASPAVTLALIARIRELEGERDRLLPRAKAADLLEVEMAKLLPLADAATAFVDEQGKLMDADYAQGDPAFAGAEWRDLVRAVEGAGR